MLNLSVLDYPDHADLVKTLTEPVCILLNGWRQEQLVYGNYRGYFVERKNSVAVPTSTAAEVFPLHGPGFIDRELPAVDFFPI